MPTERQQILEMLASGKVTVEEAEKLLNALGESSGALDTTELVPKKKVRYLRVLVSEGGTDKVNIRVPLQLLRAGVKLASVIPKDAQAQINTSLNEKGITLDISDIKPEMIDEFIDGLGELTVDIGDGGEGVRVFCE